MTSHHQPDTATTMSGITHLSDVDHVRQRPAMYLGCDREVTEGSYYGPEKDGDRLRMLHHTTEVCPGLFKCFDELLVNAGDYSDPNSKVDVRFLENGTLIVHNSRGIPVHLMEDGQTWNITGAFGMMRTGSNFDDSQGRTVGGLNGVGAKLCNILGNRFEVLTKDPNTGLIFKQVWQEHMSRVRSPHVRRKTKKKLPGGLPSHVKARIVYFDDLPEGFKKGTRISYSPDYDFFGENTFERIKVSAAHFIRRRCVEIAATRSVKVFFNGEAMPCRSLRDLARMYMEDPKGKTVLLSGTGGCDEDRWQAVVIPKVGENLSHSLSWVNGIPTPEGGEHVKAYNAFIQKVVNKLVPSSLKDEEKRAKRREITKFVKDNMDLVVSAVIVNPRFNNQGKTKLESKKATWGSVPTFTASDVSKTVSMVRDAVREAEERAKQEAFSQSTRRRQGRTRIPGFDDATKAGTSGWEECSLILTEGLSAKALASRMVRAMGKKGPKYWGVFPLLGKLLNVLMRSAANNKEITNLMIALGMKLQNIGRSEQDRLRYGSIVIMTDQDPDGSHIKGLVAAMLAKFYPKGLRRRGFVKIFHTPIVRATCGTEVVDFYSQPEADAWIAARAGRRVHVKYYKGLGSWTNKDADAMAGRLERHLVPMDAATPEDISAIEKAFGPDSSFRRDLVNGVPSLQPLDPRTVTSWRGFVYTELSRFFHYDNARSIPGLDGLKISQRKIIQAVLDQSSLPLPGGKSRGPKVAQLVGKVSSEMAYHHGEASLEKAIVNLAQDFPGSNNLPLLFPDGQFGTEAQGGKDHAASRYIFTTVQPYLRALFPSTTVLDYLEEDGSRIEPRMFFPVVPLSLVNGVKAGIGSGWATVLPPHRTTDVVQWLRAKLDMNETISVPMPSFEDFQRGSVNGGRVEFSGTQAEEKDGVRVHSLAPGVWTDKFVADFSEECEVTKSINDEGGVEFYLDPVEEDSSSSSSSSGGSKKRKRGTLIERVSKKNKTSISLQQMYLFAPGSGEDLELRHFQTTDDIMNAYVEHGRLVYAKSHAALVESLQRKYDELCTKRNYISHFVEQRVHYERGSLNVPHLVSLMQGNSERTQELLRSVTDLQKTEEKIRSLEESMEEARADLAEWQSKDWRIMWLHDIDRFVSTLPEKYTTQ